MANKIYIQLRNKIFYYRVELPRVNNKRRYKIISLHTQNYFEAQEKIKQLITQEEKLIRLRRLFNNLIFETSDTTSIATLVTSFSRRLIKRASSAGGNMFCCAPPQNTNGFGKADIPVFFISLRLKQTHTPSVRIQHDCAVLPGQLPGKCRFSRS